MDCLSQVRNEEYVLKIEATEQSRAKLSDRYSDLGIQNDSLAAHTRECEEKLAEMAAEVWLHFPVPLAISYHPQFKSVLLLFHPFSWISYNHRPALNTCVAALKLSEAQEGLVERDELAFHVNTLEDTVRDLASKAEMSDNYR